MRYAGVAIGIGAALWAAGAIQRYAGPGKSIRALSIATFFVFAAHEPMLTSLIKASYAVIRPAQSASVIFIYFAAPLIVISFCVALYHIGNSFAPVFMQVVCGGRIQAGRTGTALARAAE